MSNEKQKFGVLDENVESKIFTSGQWMKSCGVGEIELIVKLSNKSTNRVKLTNFAIFVPELKSNLISIP